MDILRERILARVVALLLGVTPAGNNVFRAREVSIVKSQTPAITVMFDGEDSQPMGSFATQHQATVVCAIFVRGDPWDQLANAIDGPLHRALLSDTALRDLITKIERIGTSPESEEADRTAGTLEVRYRVTFLTSTADLAAAPV